MRVPQRKSPPGANPTGQEVNRRRNDAAVTVSNQSHFDLESERTVLARLLQYGSQDLPENAPTSSRYFSAPNGIIFDAIQTLRNDSKQVNLIEVTQSLVSSGLLETVGGAAYVTELAGRECHLGILESACNSLVIHFKRREANELLGDAQELINQWRTDEGLALLEHGASAIKDFGGNKSSGRFAALLDERRFNPAVKIAKPEPIITLNDHSILTPGNLAAVQAQAKVGKSATIGAIIAATINPECDSFGFSCENTRGLGVVHFDTEQSPYDHQNLIRLALFRAGKINPPNWLRSYCLTDVPLLDRRRALGFELERAKTECGGIWLAIIDGVGDLCASPNDEAESLGLVDSLHQLAIRFECGIICVLHENPGSLNQQAGKTRGHLGSQLERKAETNLRLSKDAEGVVTIFSTRARHANITENSGPRFAWDDAKKMHVSVASARASKDESKREHWKEMAGMIFQDTLSIQGMTWAGVHEAIEGLEGISRATARKHFQAMKDCGAIIKKGERYYCGK